MKIGPATKIASMTNNEINLAIAKEKGRLFMKLANGETGYFIHEPGSTDNLQRLVQVSTPDWAVSSHSSLELLKEMNEAQPVGDPILGVAYHKWREKWTVLREDSLSYPFSFCPTAPRAICEAFLLFTQKIDK